LFLSQDAWVPVAFELAAADEGVTCLGCVPL
jgi:hypothetical protein